MFVAVILHHHLSGDTDEKFRFGWFLIVSLFLWCFQAQELLVGSREILDGREKYLGTISRCSIYFYVMLYFVSIPGALLIGITFFRLHNFKYALPLGGIPIIPSPTNLNNQSF